MGGDLGELRSQDITGFCCEGNEEMKREENPNWKRKIPQERKKMFIWPYGKRINTEYNLEYALVVSVLVKLKYTVVIKLSVSYNEVRKL